MSGKKGMKGSVSRLCLAMVAGLALSLLGGCGPEKEYVDVGPNWVALNELKGGDDFRVIVRTKAQYRVGDDIALRVTSQEAGRLWVMYVDPDDTVAVLYPNDLVSDNKIRAGETIELPGQGWELKAEEPLGPSVLVGIVTTGDMHALDALRQGTGEKEVRMSKALTLAREAQTWGLGKAVISVE